MSAPHKEKIKCEFCQFETKYSTNMKVHLARLHHQGSKVTCPYCDFETFHYGPLKEHILRFHEFKTYICKKCTFSTTNNESYQRHLLRFHRIGDPNQFVKYEFSRNIKRFKKKEKSIDHMSIFMEIEDKQQKSICVKTRLAVINKFFYEKINDLKILITKENKREKKNEMANLLVVIINSKNLIDIKIREICKYINKRPTATTPSVILAFLLFIHIPELSLDEACFFTQCTNVAVKSFSKLYLKKNLLNLKK